MAMKVDYGVVTKAIMVIKFENVILCFGDWSSLCHTLQIPQKRRMRATIEIKTSLQLKIIRRQLYFFNILTNIMSVSSW